jgi:hypothetical protein
MKWIASVLFSLWVSFAFGATPAQLTALQPYDPAVTAIEYQIATGCGRPVSAFEDSQYFYTRSVFDRYAVWSALVSFQDWNAADLCSSLIDFKNPQPPAYNASFTGSLVPVGGPRANSTLTVTAVSFGIIVPTQTISWSGGTASIGSNGTGHGGVGTYIVLGNHTVSSTSMNASPSLTTTSLLPLGGITQTPYQGINGDAATGELEGGYWTDIQGIGQDNVGVSIWSAAPSGSDNGILGITGKVDALGLETAGPTKSVDRLHSSNNPGPGTTTVGGLTAWDTASPSTSTVQVYYNGVPKVTQTRTSAFPTPPDNYAFIGGIGSGSPATYSSDLDVFATIEPSESAAWYANEFKALLISGQRTGATSVQPVGPVWANGCPGSLGCNGFTQGQIASTSPANLILANNKAPPVQNSDPNYQWYPVSTPWAGALQCAPGSTTWTPPTIGFSNAYNISHGGCIVLKWTNRCNTVACGSGQWNQLEISPTCTLAACAGIPIRLGYSTPATAHASNQADLDWSTNPNSANPAGSNCGTGAYTGYTSYTTAAGIPSGDVYGYTAFITAFNAGSIPYFQTSGHAGSFVVPQVAISSGAISGTTLTVSGAVTGTIAVGQSVTDPTQLVEAGTTITALGSGTGGDGTYTVSNSQTVSAEAMNASPWNIVVLDRAPACSIQTSLVTLAFLLDYEPADLGGIPANNSVAVAHVTSLASIVGANGYTLGLDIDSLYGINTFKSNINSTTLPSIFAISNVSYVTLAIDATTSNTVAKQVTDGLTTMNGGTPCTLSPANCTALLPHVGMKMLLPTLTAAQWSQMNGQLGTWGINELEVYPSQNQLGGENCAGSGVYVLNPQKWGYGIGIPTGPC